MDPFTIFALSLVAAVFRSSVRNGAEWHDREAGWQRHLDADPDLVPYDGDGFGADDRRISQIGPDRGGGVRVGHHQRHVEHHDAEGAVVLAAHHQPRRVLAREPRPWAAR